MAAGRRLSALILLCFALLLALAPSCEAGGRKGGRKRGGGGSWGSRKLLKPWEGKKKKIKGGGGRWGSAASRKKKKGRKGRKPKARGKKPSAFALTPSARSTFALTGIACADAGCRMALSETKRPSPDDIALTFGLPAYQLELISMLTSMDSSNIESRIACTQFPWGRACP